MSTLLYPVLAFSIGFILVYLSIPTIIHVSKVKHLYDEPNERKATKKIVPTLGGVAIFIGLTLSTIIGTSDYTFHELKYLIAAITIMFFVGLKDDIVTISARKKLYMQILTAIILITLGDFRFTSLHGLLGIYEINYISSFIISCFTIIVLINAFNLIDGIDGLASGVSILVASTLGTWFLLSGHKEYGIMCYGLVGSLIAFFLYNVFGNTNKIFMGDTGSLILGITMSIIIIKFNEFNINSSSPVAISSAPAVSLGVLILPIIDTLRVFFIRISEGKSPFTPDMNHIHHKLLKIGHSHLHSTMIIIAINSVFVAMGFFLSFSFDINFLFLTIFLSGLAIGYLPSFYLKYKQNEFTSLSVLNIQQDHLETKSVRIPSKIFPPKTNSESFSAFKIKQDPFKSKRIKQDV